MMKKFYYHPAWGHLTIMIFRYHLNKKEGVGGVLQFSRI
jgi:hypothetical protein